MGKFIKVGFYTVGTFLLVFSSIVVGANFVKDSGVFDKAVVEVKKQPQKAQAAASTSPVIADTKPVDKEPAKVTPATVNNEKLSVEVVNCTGIRGLAEETRTMLEAKGYTVSAGNNTDSTKGTSQIIIRKKGVNTDLIRNMLKIYVIKEELQSESRFDVTIIIGSDFNP